MDGEFPEEDAATIADVVPRLFYPGSEEPFSSKGDRAMT